MKKIIIPPEPPSSYKSKVTGNEFDEAMEIVKNLHVDIEHLNSEIDRLDERIDGKVNKHPGKGLSTNDYTNTDKNKVAQLPTKEELDTLIDNKQDKLVSGENIKTINGESVLGEGDIDIQSIVIANEGFPESWPKAGWIYNEDNRESDLIYAINHDDKAVEGKIYLSTVSYRDLPRGLMQAEMKVEVMRVYSTYSKILLFTITSSDLSPYHWEYTSAYDSEGAWRSWATSEEAEKSANKVRQLTASSTHEQYPSAKTIYDILSGMFTVVNEEMIIKTV